MLLTTRRNSCMVACIKGAGVWSGDIWCTFDVLRTQVHTGLSAQTSGFSLWTTDVGGYSAPPNGNCDATNSSYRELIVRWFQFGVTCPIFRQHGQRDTEIWKFGDAAEAILADIIKWRASIKPYLHQEMVSCTRIVGGCVRACMSVRACVRA